MVKEFNNLEEIQKYYDENTNTYIFKENDEYIDLVVFNFDLDVKANINALDIYACNIDANNIDANDINALDIKANDITYCAVCFAYNNIKCKSIKGRRINAKHFVLGGKLEVENEKLQQKHNEELDETRIDRAY